MPVRFQLNGRPRTPARINMVPIGDGSYYLHLNGIVRRATSTTVGDRVSVAIRFDPEYRGGPVHPMPRRLRAGLRADATARTNWRALPPSRKKEILRYLAALRSTEARDRNIDRALRALGGGRARFLGREWNAPAPDRTTWARAVPRPARTNR